MKNKIFIGYQEDSLLKEAEVAEKDVSIIRYLDTPLVRNFGDYSHSNQVLIVNSMGFSDENFGIFLKLLENPYVKGEIWFTGRDLSSYPFTIRSRCTVEVMPDSLWHKMAVRNLEETGELGLLNTVMGLRHYGMGRAKKYAHDVEKFVGMMYCLETVDNFNVFLNRLDEVEESYLDLFLEWLHMNSIFSEKQLSICKPLRSDEFLKTAGLFEGHQFVDVVKATFLHMYTYLMLTGR